MSGDSYVPATQPKPRLLDLFSCQGGAAMGYHRAGFEVVGVDRDPQPRYPFEHHVADAMSFPLDGFDVVHASPPCQHYAAVTAWRGDQSKHADLVDATRERLEAWGGPYVIENVREAPLRSSLMLCGTMFGLRVKRHRYFEVSPPIAAWAPAACDHRGVLPFEHKGERAFADAMGCGWMSNKGGRQAVPPAYTQWIGSQLLAALAVAS